MPAWREEEADAARHRQEKREASRLGNLLSRKRRILRSNTLDLVDESKESLCGRETDRDLRSACRCVACCCCFFLRTSSVGGGRGCAARILFCSLFPVQQTTSGIGHV